MTRKPEFLILGAGAAGLMAAWKAAEQGASVTLVEGASRAGNKIRVAGGGKGNVTNRSIAPDRYVGEDPDFCRPVLKSYGSRAALRMLESLHIALEEREDGQLFCQASAAHLVEVLLDRCRERHVRLLFEQRILALEHDGQEFVALLEDARGGRAAVRAQRALIALGSPAWPQIGASDLGHRLARQFGHRIVPARPALSPFIMPETWPLHGLAGISLRARIAMEQRTFEQAVLFTHKGLSGPAALQASCFWRKGKPLIVDFLPSVRLKDALHAVEHGKLQVRTLLGRLLPDRLADALIPADLASRKVAEVGKKDRERLALCVHNHQVVPLRLEGLTKAEAAAGGVDTRDVDPETLESRLRPGLYFAGEVLDVTGLLGGYNLHWAWASGCAAGSTAASSTL